VKDEEPRRSESQAHLKVALLQMVSEERAKALHARVDSRSRKARSEHWVFSRSVNRGRDS
jgi:hypothetical protein